MGEQAEPQGEVQVLGESRIWPAVAVPGVAAVILVAVAAYFRFVSGLAVGAVGASLVVAVLWRRNAVLADDVGLLIRGRRGTRRSYAWSEIDRMGWLDTGLWGSVLELHPKGGPYDVPGPNSPVRPARIWRPGRRRHADPLLPLLRRHGVKSLTDP